MSTSVCVGSHGSDVRRLPMSNKDLWQTTQQVLVEEEEILKKKWGWVGYTPYIVTETNFQHHQTMP